MKFFYCALLMWVAGVASVSAQSNVADFLKNKVKQQGYFSFYHDPSTGKVFLALTEFEQQFLFQSSMPHGIGSNDLGLDRGQLGDTRLVQFERVGNKVFLRQLNSYYRANSSNELEQQAIDEAFASSIIWGFKVEDVEETEQGVFIDYTPFLLSDIHGVAEKLKKSKQGSYKIAESRSGLYEKRSKAFPDNSEFEATVTFVGEEAGELIQTVTPDAHAVTVNFHHSLIRLPDSNYNSRAFHPYSGYWAESFADYGTTLDQPLIQRVIPRHRLNKIDPNATISKAKQPIVYYLDAGVPEPIRSALLDGARWWDNAFQAIGYQDAFQVKMLPEHADPMDVRYNVIQWVHRATRGWSYGSSVIDPRTGEIIKGHVTLGSLRVRQDYLIALGLTSPFKSALTDTSIMKNMALARIRQLAAHEVGHTLGLAHNFAGSANDRASVMDYPHPLIELTEGEIDLSNAYSSGVGAWDNFAIAYGYSDFADRQEANELATLIKQTQAQGLQYVSDPDARPASGAHASGHLWDNGANAVQELQKVLSIRAKALSVFGLNSIPVGTPLSELETVLVPIYNFHRFQVEAAAKLIAGIEYSYSVRSTVNNNIMKNVAGNFQQQALTALLETLATETLTLPDHIVKLIPPKAYGYQRDRESFVSKTGITFDPISIAQASAKHTVSLLLNGQRLARLQQQHQVDKNVPSVAELIAQMVTATVKRSATIDLSLLVQHRINQQVVEHLLMLWHDNDVVTEVKAEVFVALTDLLEWFKENQNKREYKGLLSQYLMLENQISFSLTQGKMVMPVSVIDLPPGSPIGNGYSSYEGN